MIPPVAVPASPSAPSGDGADGTDPTTTAGLFAALVAGFLAPSIGAAPTLTDSPLTASAAAPAGDQPSAMLAAVPSVTIDPSAVQAGSFVPLTGDDAVATPAPPATPTLTAPAPALTTPAPVLTATTPAAPAAPAAPLATVNLAADPSITIGKDATPAPVASDPAPVAEAMQPAVDTPAPSVAPQAAAVEAPKPVPSDHKPASSSIETVPDAVEVAPAPTAAGETSEVETVAAPQAVVVEDVDGTDDDITPLPTVEHATPSSITTEAPATISRPHAPAPTVDVQPHQQIVSIVAPLRRHGDGSYRLNLHLRPAELGPVNLEVELHHGVVELHMAAEHDHARELLIEHLGDLRRELTEAGLTPGNLDVADGDQSRHQFTAQGAPVPFAGSALGADVTATPAPAPVSPSVSVSAASGLDARL